MNYPKVGEWVFDPVLGKEVTLMKASGDAGCKSDRFVCIYNLNVMFNDCNERRCIGAEIGRGIFVDRATWPVARLLRGTS